MELVDFNANQEMYVTRALQIHWTELENTDSFSNHIPSRGMALNW
jgi:hypothetical protein